MTACVNRKHSRRVAAVISASLVGALSLGIAPVAAMANDGIDLLASDADAWKSNKIEYTAEADVDGNYSVKAGDTFAVDSITNVYGETVSPSDYTVLYANYNATASSASLVGSTSSLDGRKGGMPNTAGTYYIVIVEGDIDVDASAYWTLGSVIPSGTNYTVQEFQVDSTGTSSLNGTYAHEGTDFSDTAFQYDGASFNVSFAKGKTNLAEGTDYDIEWTALPVGEAAPTYSAGTGYSVLHAGTYTAQLTGKNTYAGSTATVTFTVSPIDLAKDTITIAPSTSGFGSISASDISVNGVQLDAAAAVSTRIVEVNDGEGVVGDKGKYLIRITPATGAGSDVTGSYADVVAYYVDAEVDYSYNGKSLTGGASFGNFDPDLNNGFDPSKISASISGGGTSVGYTYKVLDSEGNETTSWNEPGEYSLVLETPYAEASGVKYYGSLQCKFTVSGPTVDYSGATVFVSVDGKNVPSTGHVSYTGEAIAPVYAVKVGKDVLVEGEDYTLTLTKGDEEVSEIKDPGTYTLTFKMNDTSESEIPYTIVVDKAKILSAQPTAEFFATDGETAATPTFTGSTNADYSKGIKFDLPADEISVRYYELADSNGDGVVDGEDTGKGAAVEASDLTENGWYLAEINVLTNSATISGTGVTCAFQVSDYAAFTDVDASAWYAESVYNAAELGYMTGISGTKLFMPMADITRAELAQVFFNMAGKASTGGTVYYPTKFDDVDGWAWYAQPVAWASDAGIVTGYADDAFGPTDNATREQVAVMLYRYAEAQGKDVSVEDADAALAKYADGDQVSDWAKDAMAWAVENGIFGVDTDQLWAQENIQRAAVASIAVRFQPEALK